MRIIVDKESSLIYISFVKKEDDYPGIAANTVIVDENINIDYDKEGKLVGIEILALSILDLEQLKKVEYLEDKE
jgi:uncharacterized protein YuzE